MGSAALEIAAKVENIKATRMIERISLFKSIPPYWLFSAADSILQKGSLTFTHNIMTHIHAP